MASWRRNNCERNSTRPSREKRGSTASDHPACDPSRPSGVVEPEGEAGLLLLQSLGSPPLSVHANLNGVVLSNGFDGPLGDRYLKVWGIRWWLRIIEPSGRRRRRMLHARRLHPLTASGSTRSNPSHPWTTSRASAARIPTAL